MKKGFSLRKAIIGDYIIIHYILRTFLAQSMLIIISFFFISPIILDFTKERSLLSNDFENNSKNNLEKLLQNKNIN